LLPYTTLFRSDGGIPLLGERRLDGLELAPLLGLVALPLLLFPLGLRSCLGGEPLLGLLALGGQEVVELLLLLLVERDVVVLRRVCGRILGILWRISRRVSRRVVATPDGWQRAGALELLEQLVDERWTGDRDRREHRMVSPGHEPGPVRSSRR